MSKVTNPRKVIYRAELIKVLPDGTQKYRVVKDTKPPKQPRKLIADHEERFRELHTQGLTDAEMGEKLGFSRTVVGLFRNSLGLPTAYKRRGISNHNTQFMELYNQGLSDGKIGKAMGFTKGAVNAYRRKKLGLPAHFKFGMEKIVFSEEEKKKIIEMRSGGASIADIAEEFNVSGITMYKRCKEMGVDTSRMALGWIKKEKDGIRLWEYLDEHGPMTRSEIEEDLHISSAKLYEYVVSLWDNIFERFKFVASSRGGTKYGGANIYGDLSFSQIGLVISLRNDPRLIDYIADRIPFKVKDYYDARTLVIHLKRQVGIDRARDVVRRQGYVFGEDIKRTPKARARKFTDDQLIELYDEKLSDLKIGKRLGVTASAVCMRRNRLELPPHYVTGGRRKFTDDQLMELYDEKLGDAEISRKLGVSSSAVGVRRKRLELPSHYGPGRRRKPDPLDGLDQIEKVD